MPLKKGHSAQARNYNIRHLVRAGYPREQAIAIAYRIGRKSRANVPDELGEILSEDFWISPRDAKEALDAVRRSVNSLNTDMVQATAAGTLPAGEAAEWAKWRRQFEQYYANTVNSFLGWRLLDSTGVLYEAERLATDLNAWRDRFTHFTSQRPGSPSPVRTHAGTAQGPWSALLTGVAAVGAVALAWRIYKDMR